MAAAVLDDLRNKGEEHRNRMARRSRAQTRAASEIGPPPITSKQRAQGTRLRNKCRNDLELFNSLAFPNSTGLKPFGSVQKDSIAHDQQVILHGGRVCKAEPRGYGKTTRTGNAALWGVCYRYRRMVPVFSANMDKSKSLMDRWQTELMTNQSLLLMFPELVWPLRALENRGQRCASQTFNELPTFTQWTSDRIVFPTIDKVVGSGAVLIALPLKSCRGAIHATPDGTVLRPDLAIFDDVQTDEDADNPNTVKKLESLIDHTAMMLGGHSQTMSAIMNCTVRQLEDLGEQFLKKPSWRRIRYKLLDSPAKREKEFWLGEYADIRSSYDPDSPDDQRRAHLESLKLYESKREVADEGAVATWDWAYAWNDDEPTEISSVQHAYNLLIDNGEEVFASECQNAPLRRKTTGVELLTAEQIIAKTSPPSPDATTLTGFIDISDHVLYWEIWCWSPDETGYQVGGGSYPDQHKSYFSHRQPPVPLEKLFPKMSLEARITQGLDALLHGHKDWPGLMSMTWDIGDTPTSIKLCGVDANGTHRDLIVRLLSNSTHKANLYPSFGIGIGARRCPITGWVQYRKQHAHDNWLWRKGNKGEIPGVQFCANSFKTKFHRRLALQRGTKSGLYLNPKAPDLRMVADHYLGEFPTEVSAEGRTVIEWSEIPNKPNHRLDCAIGNLVAASILGVGRSRPVQQSRRRKRTTYF